jgi:DNA-binding CsgD family transcriptional regulator
METPAPDPTPRYLDALNTSTTLGLMMWVIDSNNIITEATQACADLCQTTLPDLIGCEVRHLKGIDSAINMEEQYHINRMVRSTGKPQTLSYWVNPRSNLSNGQWIKILLTKTLLSSEHMLVVAVDITDTDPRGKWLQRIDLPTQRLRLRGGRYLTYRQVVILHHLLRGRTRSEIAAHLQISENGVDYNKQRIKAALDVDTNEHLLARIAEIGLIHLLTIEFDPNDPATDARTLYRRASDLPDD